MRTIAICNQKGGVAKTTTSLTLQSGLTEKGKRTLLIDLDSQRNSTTTKGEGADFSILDVLEGRADIKDAISKSESGDFIRGEKGLSLIKGLTDSTLRDKIQPLHRAYDIVIIDCPPSLGDLTVNALVSADYVIVPAVADEYSAYGLMDLKKIIDLVRSGANKKLKVMGVLLTMHNPRLKESKRLEGELAEITKALGISLFDTTIRHSFKVREAQGKGKGLLRYKTPIAEDYRAFTEEVLQRLK